MTSYIKRILRRFLTVQTYHVKRTDWLKLYEDTHSQLARELGREWKPRERAER